MFFAQWLTAVDKLGLRTTYMHSDKGKKRAVHLLVSLLQPPAWRADVARRVARAGTAQVQELISILTDMAGAGHVHRTAVPKVLRADLERLRIQLGTEVSDAALTVGMTAWAAVMGAVNLELFGHLHNVVNQRGALFDAVVEQHAAFITA